MRGLLHQGLDICIEQYLDEQPAEGEPIDEDNPMHIDVDACITTADAWDAMITQDDKEFNQ